MKVSNVGANKGPAAPRRTTRGAGTGSDFARHLEGLGAAEGAPAPETAAEVGALGGIDAVIATQDAGDAPERQARARARRHGEDLLGRLEGLRRRLLAGVVPRAELVQLAQSLRRRRERSADAALEAIIAEIELRAEVEIAKLARADAEARARA